MLTSTNARRVSLLALLSLSGACAPVLSNTPVEGDRTTLQHLAGNWEGVYSSVESGRSGTISFRLRAGADTAQGEVIMTTRMNEVTGKYGNTEQAQRALPVSQLLTIRFVVAANDEVRGMLDPYPDAACECTLITRFRGRLSGNVIKGTIESRSSSFFHRTAIGEWSVTRTAVATAVDMHPSLDLRKQ